MTETEWVDCPKCDAKIGVPSHVCRVVGLCPQCGMRLSIDRPDK